MNADSEQITLDMNILVAPDQPLNEKGLHEAIMSALGQDHCRLVRIPPRRWVVEYTDESGCVHHLLAKACTYLGNPHPIYKKRVQLPAWFNEYAESVSLSDSDIDVRYVGVYRFSDRYHGDNIIFIDFKKDTYLLRSANNSSAHVYTNDLFQAMTYGIFSKEDANGNHIAAIRRDKFREYLAGDSGVLPETLFGLFDKFNAGFPFGDWIEALTAIDAMHSDGWPQWRQAEWPGWFLEYKFNDFTVSNGVERKMRYVGSSMKGEADLDFDIRFDEEDFYGDLKASDVSRKETPGNDQDNLVECIRRYNRFWYVIYEHETIKDKDKDYFATIGRNRYIKSIDPSYEKDEMSYSSRMKHSVRFVKMAIIELNRVNYRDALTVFNQGHQPDGSARRPKFLINKNVMNNDNFVVFRYTFER